MTKKIVWVSAILILLLVIPVVCKEVSATGSIQDQPSAYVLGPSDSITIQAVDVEEISNKPIWIDT
ncbi:MAG TPA: hypothetical protein VFS12_13985, partial [Terriglobia bacterium]|nr:hypothetical protein [Terriglobia bacterium]